MTAGETKEKELRATAAALQSALDAAHSTSDAVKKARDEMEHLLGTARNETTAAEGRLRELSAARDKEAAAAAAAATEAKASLEEARSALEREKYMRTMELELAAKAREESEKRWEGKWETLPAHHESR